MPEGFSPNAQEAARYSANLKQYAEDYWKCLVANSLYRIEENIPFKNSDIIKICMSYREEFYKASYYASFGGYENKSVRDDFRHATARKDISIAETSAFGSVDDVR